MSLLILIGSAQGLIIADANAKNIAADSFIDGISQQVLSGIKNDPDIQAGKQARINALVDEFIMPYINFQRTTALSVGRSWRLATEQQRQALIKEFRLMLLRTYAGAISQVREEQVRVMPLRAKPSDTDVIVRSQIIGRGEPIELGYRLEKSGNSWLIYDLNVMGVWVIQTYRSQFKPIISEQGIDGLIKTLSDKNNQS